jgi:hypothetical protein
MIRASSPGRGWEVFSSPPCPDWLWGPPRPLSNGYWGQSSQVQRSMHGANLHSPIRLHYVVLTLKRAQGQLYLYALNDILSWFLIAQILLQSLNFIQHYLLWLFSFVFGISYVCPLFMVHKVTAKKIVAILRICKWQLNSFFFPVMTNA